MIATTSEDAEGVCKSVAWLGNEEIAISGDAFIYRHTLNPKYVAYIFQTSRFLEHKIQYKFEGAAPEHMRESLKECADMAAVLDERMLALNESLQREEKKV